jgi:hypothetical protein
MDDTLVAHYQYALMDDKKPAPRDPARQERVESPGDTLVQVDGRDTASLHS